jgi:FAD/FMN-containing dehydrogenase
MRPISSWGRLNNLPHEVVSLNDPKRIINQIAKGRCNGIAFGMGRSYGDACLNPEGPLWVTTGLNHFIAFDEINGSLVCEAGVLLNDIQQLTVPRGWMLPVTPGTQLITVGGAIANDIHGKNHHVFGCFGNHVQRIKLLRTDGETINCSPHQNPSWFAATIGGLGLTGIIVEVEIQLRRVDSSWLDIETVPYESLDEFFNLADGSESSWEHTVSWIDCASSSLGRGIFMRANPSASGESETPKDRLFRMPIAPPFSMVNRLTLSLFNSFYFNTKKWNAGRSKAYYKEFLYPLDSLHDWNRMYGPKGFFQHQSLIPREAGHDAVIEMLDEIKASGDGSFLTVLKTFGKVQAVGMMSFPQPGVTLALDFPNKGARTIELFKRLDAIVRNANGRIYPAKDALMSRDMFEEGYPRLQEFLEFRDPGISSGLSRRLMGS